MGKRPVSRVELRAVDGADQVGLALVERWMIRDTAGRAEFGGFYGAACERLAPLLGGSDRRFYLIYADGEPVGFVDADRVGDTVGVAYFVVEQSRGHAIAASALEALGPLNQGERIRALAASIPLENRASARTAAKAGFRAIGTNEYGDMTWECLL